MGSPNTTAGLTGRPIPTITFLNADTLPQPEGTDLEWIQDLVAIGRRAGLEYYDLCDVAYRAVKDRLSLNAMPTLQGLYRVGAGQEEPQ